MSLNSWNDRAILEKAVEWTKHEETIPCYLKGEIPCPVRVKYETSSTGIIDLKSIDTLGGPRENFENLDTDIKEHFKYGHENRPYSDYWGLFCNEF